MWPTHHSRPSRVFSPLGAGPHGPGMEAFMRPRTLLLLLSGAAACAPGAIGEPAHDGHGPEVTVTGPRVMTEFPLDGGHYVSPLLEL